MDLGKLSVRKLTEYGENPTVDRVVVRVINRQQGNAIVVALEGSTLATGDEIIVVGNESLKPGMEVRIQKQIRSGGVQ